MWNPHRGGGSLHRQVEHHVRNKFATPMLYGIDSFIFHDVFFLNITSFVYFFEILAIFIFYSNCFSSIMRHSS